MRYGYPAGAIGSALIETEEEWEEPVPPLNKKYPGQNYQRTVSRKRASVNIVPRIG
jgi:hypothetical protein